MNISLPSFDELVTAGKKPICTTESAGKEDRSFSVHKTSRRSTKTEGRGLLPRFHGL